MGEIIVNVNSVTSVHIPDVMECAEILPLDKDFKTRK